MIEEASIELDTVQSMPVIIDERSGYPKFTSMGMKAVRCVKCNKVVFSNYRLNDFECEKCKGPNMIQL